MKSRILHGICKLLLVVGCGFLSVVLVANAIVVAVVASASAVVIDGGAAGEAQQPPLMLFECVLYLCCICALRNVNLQCESPTNSAWDVGF